MSLTQQEIYSAFAAGTDRDVRVVRWVGNSGPRAWILDRLDLIRRLPEGADDARRCACGAIYAWKGGPDAEPTCPVCKGRWARPADACAVA
jgi:hypothetical protein